MLKEIIKNTSINLDREMEYIRYGNSGKPVLVIPSQDGKPIDYENFGMVESLSSLITEGTIQLFCVDSIDVETFSSSEGNIEDRMKKHEKYVKYIYEEIIPEIHNKTNRKDILVTGCSMGAIHSAILFFRRPELFSSMLGLSGGYNLEIFFNEYMSELVYINSVTKFIKEMDINDEKLQEYRKKKIVTCIGLGNWEEELIPSNYVLKEVLEEKEIPAKINFWGKEVYHDWIWWKKQIQEYIYEVI